MDDVENDEDLQDLEARLYAQVHHESGQEEFAALEKSEQPSRLVTSTSVINRTTGNVPRGRYWTNNQSPVASQHKKFSSEKSAGDTKSKFEVAAASTSASTETQSSIDLKRSASSPVDTGVTLLEASGGDPEIKRSPNPLNEKNIAKKNVPAAKDAQDPAVATDSANKSANWMNRKLNKLNRNKKIQQKKAKAKQAREKQKSAVETIVLDSSDEDEDVIEIPVPPPPILTIDSSDDEEKPDVDSFAKPNDVKHDQSKPGAGSNSRCNSPSSVMSDDFIGQQDKSRLLTEVSAADDEDLQCIGGTSVNVSPPQNAGQADASEQPADFATPKKRVSKSSKQKQSTYEVTQSNFRAVDVYESESSDMPESVYGKGGERNVLTNKLSSSDAEDIEIVPKTKKLFRKRKASGSCRGSEPNDDSTDSEKSAPNDVALPFISRGEAVENCKQKLKKRQHSTRLDVNSSDNEFIHKLADIVHGDNAKDVDESHESNHSGDETITARHIAEDVLNQGQEGVVDVEQEKAIPQKTVTDLDNVLKFIDALDTSYYATKEQSRPRAIVPETLGDVERIESPELDVEVTVDDLREKEKPTEPEMGDPDANTVYSNRDHVAWTEEMIRFYENSWGEENFNIDQIMRTMDRSGNWRIRNNDRFPRAGKFSNVKCNNCSEFGHMRARCPQPKKDLICCMCGEIGHREPRCPNTICLRCGRKWNIFTRTCSICVTNNKLICPVCKIRGHGIDLCPDKWRRYHSTTTINAHPNPKLFYNERKACCICGGLGHLPERCKSSNKLTEYHTPVSEIRSHAKSYEDVAVKEPLPAGVVGVNLMCEPNDRVQFPFASKVTTDNCYGRFISAVGLLYNRKRPSTVQNVQIKKKRSKKNYVLNPFATNFSLSDELNELDDAHNVVSEVFVNNEGDKSNTGESMPLDEAATFKSPNDLPESNSNVDKKSDGVKLIFKKDKAIDDAAVDSDSNYSFSEHFSHNETTVESSPPKKSRGREVGPLPDFIPLVDSDDDGGDEIQDNEAGSGGLKKGPISGIKLNIDNQEEEEVEEICEGKIYLNEFHTKFLSSADGTKFLDEISKMHHVDASIDANAQRSVLIIKGYPTNQESFHTDLMDKIKNLSNQDEEVCEAKIYLNKFHSKFLLSPNGNKFLIETSKKNNVKASIEWTAVGNVLIIEGVPSNQDNFHSELMQAIKKLSDDLNRKELEQSTKVPRKREALIKFLQENFLLLENDIGNPNDLYRRVRINENEINKSRFKAAERSRRQLNIILMGQAGLRDGHMHLYALQKNLKTLISDDSIQDVPAELRDEIDEHWKYIFSSYPHENYDQLIRQYFELKKSNRLPKLHLDGRLLGKKQLDTTFTKEQNDQLMKPPAIVPHPNENSSSKSKMVINPMSLSQPDMAPIELKSPQSHEDQPPKNPQKQKRPDGQRAGLNMFQNQLKKIINQQDQSQNRYQRPNRQQNQQQQQQVQRNRQQYQPQNRQQRQQQNRQQNRQQQQQQNRQQFSQQNRPNQSNQQPGASGDGESFASEKIREINKKWENQADVLMNQMTKQTPPNVPKSSASPHWSRQCLKYIDCCKSVCSNPIVAEKLTLLTERASKNLLSLNDFKSLQRIYFSVLKPKYENERGGRS